MFYGSTGGKEWLLKESGLAGGFILIAGLDGIRYAVPTAEAWASSTMLTNATTRRWCTYMAG